MMKKVGRSRTSSKQYVLMLLFSTTALLVGVVDGARRRQRSNDRYDHRNELSIHEFASISYSEADTTFIDCSTSTAVEQWYAAIDYEWEMRRYEEERRRLEVLDENKRRRSLQGDDEDVGTVDGDPLDNDTEVSDSEAVSPYVLCDFEDGQTGGKVFQEFKEKVGDAELVDFINEEGRICYVVSITASEASEILFSQDEEKSITPLPAETKIGSGSTDLILNGEDIPPGITGSFCVAGSQEEGNALLQEIVDSLKAEGDGQQRRRFLRESHTRNPDVHEKWERHLQDTNATACTPFYENGLSIQTRLDGRGFSMMNRFAFREEDSTLNRQCLVTLLLEVASYAQVCYVAAEVQMKTSNVNAAFLGQTDNANDKYPFHDADITGEGEIAQVSDTGLDQASCYFRDDSNPRVPARGYEGLSGNWASATRSSNRKVIQYLYNDYAQLYDNDDWSGDDFEQFSGHGTHVAGTIAGFSIQNFDGGSYGQAKDGKIAMFDVTGGSGGSIHPPEDLEADNNMLWMGYQAGAKFHSASWGGNSNGQLDSRPNRFDKFMNLYDDYLFFVAAGNSGPSIQSIKTPGTTKNGIAVGMTYSVGANQDALNAGSSRGPTADGRIKPDIVAPGSSTVSARASGDAAVASCATTSKTGTSMATPLVTGTAMLARQYFRDGFYPGGVKGSSTEHLNPSGALIKAVLLIGAQELAWTSSARNTRTFYYDTYQGFGKLKLSYSLPLQGVPPLFRNLVWDRQPLAEGELHTYDIVINEDACTYPDLRVMMTYMDDPITFGSCSGPGSCIRQNIDLVVTKTSGTSTGRNYFPNGRNSPDGVNVAERIIIGDAVDGNTYQIRVSGTSFVNNQPKNYALVVNGCVQAAPTPSPSVSQIPSNMPSSSVTPSIAPSDIPSSSVIPSQVPSLGPSILPSENPSVSNVPSEVASDAPSSSVIPSQVPSSGPSIVPSANPSVSNVPSAVPSDYPTPFPTTPAPTPAFSLSLGGETDFVVGETITIEYTNPAVAPGDEIGIYRYCDKPSPQDRTAERVAHFDLSNTGTSGTLSHGGGGDTDFTLSELIPVDTLPVGVYTVAYLTATTVEEMIHFTVRDSAFEVGAARPWYLSGEPWLVDWDDRSNNRENGDFIGMYVGCNPSLDSIMQYKWACSGYSDTSCTSPINGLLEYDNGDGDDFIGYRNVQPWGLPPGLYTVSYNRGPYISELRAISIVEVVDETPAPSLSFSPSTGAPSSSPSDEPSLSQLPTVEESETPSLSQEPSQTPSAVPSIVPSLSTVPSVNPSKQPSSSSAPSQVPSVEPSLSLFPSVVPTTTPSISPSDSPSISAAPSTSPSKIPSVSLLPSVSSVPSAQSSESPSVSEAPSRSPSQTPSKSLVPSVEPSLAPSAQPSESPSVSGAPSLSPSQTPTESLVPSAEPSIDPSTQPSENPSAMPSTGGPFSISTGERTQFLVDSEIPIQIENNTGGSSLDVINLFRYCEEEPNVNDRITYVRLDGDVRSATFMLGGSNNDFTQNVELEVGAYMVAYFEGGDQGTIKGRTHFTVNLPNFNVNTTKARYASGETWELDWEDNSGVREVGDFVGMYVGCNPSLNSIMQYKWACSGYRDTSCTSPTNGLLQYDNSGDDDFTGYRNVQPWGLPPGLYTVSYNRGPYISELRSMAVVEVYDP